MLRFVFIAALLWPSAASAAEVKVSIGLPFVIEVGSVSESDRDGVTFTIAEAVVRNGSNPTGAIDVLCEAENADGYTWDVAGSVANLDPGEERSMRLVSSHGDTSGYFKNPITLACEVTRLDGGARR